MDYALKTGVEKIVHTSTCNVCVPTIINSLVSETNLSNPSFRIGYEYTKYLAELEVQKYMRNGLDLVIVYPSSIYGEWPATNSNIVGRIINASLNGALHFSTRNGHAIANYAYLDDVFSGHISMQKGRARERYGFGGEDMSFPSFLKLLTEVSVKEQTSLVDSRRYHHNLNPIEKSTSSYLDTRFRRQIMFNQKYSSEKAKAELNYQILPFLTRLQRTINSIQQPSI